MAYAAKSAAEQAVRQQRALSTSGVENTLLLCPYLAGPALHHAVELILQLTEAAALARMQSVT
jgi:hypothetical protein